MGLPTGAAVPDRAPQSPEERLVAGLRAANEAAYRELVEAHGGRLLAVARRILRSEEDARDCLQDAFLAAFRSIDRFEGKARLSTWLHRIVVNACLMKLRSQRRRPETLTEPDSPTFDAFGFREGPMEANTASADELLLREDVRREVHEAVEGLPDSLRLVLVLRDIEELTTTETAELLGLTPGAVKVRLHRARIALKERIGGLFE